MANESASVEKSLSIPVNQLQPNPWNRTQFDPDNLKELAESIQRVGVLEEIIVRQKDGHYQIVSGNRRCLAAQLAGLTEVPCHLKDLTDEQVSEMNIVSNLQREDVPPLEMARMVKAHMDQFKLTQEQAGEKFGKSRQWVTELLGFMQLPPEVTTNATAVALGVRPLRAIKGLPTPEHQIQVAKELGEGTLKPEGVARRVGQMHAEHGKKRKPEPVMPADSKPASPPSSSPAVVSGGSTSLRTLAAAFKADLLDRYLPQSRVGNEVRNLLISPKNGKSLLKWVAVLGLVGLLWRPVVRAVVWPFRYAGSLPAGLPTGQAGLKAVEAVVVPVPAVTAAYGPGHRIILRWKPVGEGYTYKIFVDKNHNPQVPDFFPVEGKTITTPGAIVNLFRDNCPNPALAVMAVNPDGMESDLSAPIKVELTVSNNDWSVEPLPSPRQITSSPAATGRGSMDVSKIDDGPRLTIRRGDKKGNAGNDGKEEHPVAVALPPAPPSRPQCVMDSPNVARLIWPKLSQDITYNLYFSRDPSMANPQKENIHPFHNTNVTWTPDVGIGAFWVAVTAVSSAGEESRFSPAVEVTIQ